MRVSTITYKGLAQIDPENSKLFQRFREVEKLPEREKSVLLEIIGAYIRDFKTKQAYAI